MRRLVLALALFVTACGDARSPAPTPEAPRASAADADALAARFPETLAGLERASLQAETDAALGASVTTVEARYGAENSLGEPSLEVFVTDAGSAEMIGRMGLAWDDTAYRAGSAVQATEVFDGHPARRTWDTERRAGRLQVLAGETRFVEVRGEAVEEEALDTAARVALGGL